MKHTLYATATACALLCAACAPDPDKAAARRYVEAAQTAKQAKAMFAKGDFAGALGALKSAAADVEKIPALYPSSAVALKLVSESGVRLGDFKYADIPARVASLEILADSAVAPISKTWAMAMFAQDPAEAFNALAECVSGDNSMDEAAKLALKNKMPASAGVPLKAGLLPPAPQAAPKPQAAPARAKPLSQAELAELLKQAATNAKYCAFELSASEALLKKARLIGSGGDKEFSAILRLALEKAKQISVVSLREKAFASLAAAAAEAGDEALALETISQISDPDAFEKVFADIANTLGKTKNYPAALSIASKLTNKRTRDDFLAMLAENVAYQGKTEAAMAIAARISAAPARNGAYCKIAASAYDARDYKSFVSAISKIDVSDLACLKEFLKYAEKPAMPTTAQAAAALAKMAAPHNAKMADILNSMAAKNYSAKGDPQSSVARQIINNFVETKNIAAAVEFLDANHFAADTRLRAGLAISAMPFAPQIAEAQLQSLASNARRRPVQKVEFAYIIERSALPAAQKDGLLLPLLPALK